MKLLIPLSFLQMLSISTTAMNWIASQVFNRSRKIFATCFMHKRGPSQWHLTGLFYIDSIKLHYSSSSFPWANCFLFYLLITLFYHRTKGFFIFYWVSQKSGSSFFFGSFYLLSLSVSFQLMYSSPLVGFSWSFIVKFLFSFILLPISLIIFIISTLNIF